MPPTRKTKKQIQIKTAFNRKKRKVTAPEQTEPQTDPDLEKLEKEVQELQKNLEAKESEYFQCMRGLLKRKRRQPKKVTRNVHLPVNSQKLVLATDTRVLTEKLKMLNLLTGMQVATFHDKQYCVITFQLCQGHKMLEKNGIRVDLSVEPPVIKQYSLPLGFSLKEITSHYEVIMDKNCIMDIYSGLMSYYNRLYYLQQLKDLVPYQVQIYHSTDGSLVELMFPVVLESAPEDGIQDITVRMRHDLQDSYVRQINVEEADLSELHLSKLKKQLDTLLDEPMHIGFRKCFLHQDPAKFQCTYRRSEIENVSSGQKVQQKGINKDHGYNSDSSEYSSDVQLALAEVSKQRSSMRNKD